MKKGSQESLQPSPRSAVGELIWKLVKEKFGFIELSDESKRNLIEANELLKQNSLVVYVNHTSTNDVPVGIGISLSYFTNGKRVLAPAGMKHYDLRRDFKNGVLLRMMRLLKMHMIPVVQQDDLETYPEKKRAQLVKKLKHKTTKLLSKPGSIYAITPEGTRSKTGQLLRAKKGIGKIEQFSNKPLYYLPIAILFEKFSNTPQVIVGKPLTLSDISSSAQVNLANASEQEIADMLMKQLAALLPTQNQGYYQSMV